MGLKFYRQDGANLSFWRCFWRIVLGFALLPLFPISTVLLAMNSERGTLADRLLGTTIRFAPPRKASETWTGRLFATARKVLQFDLSQIGSVAGRIREIPFRKMGKYFLLFLPLWLWLYLLACDAPYYSGWVNMTLNRYPLAGDIVERFRERRLTLLVAQLVLSLWWLWKIRDDGAPTSRGPHPV
jgi:hypothetical protein